jgi:hypothetical protein
MTHWNYLHSAATPDEQAEITALLLQRAARRRSKWVLVRGRFIPDRRRLPQNYHLVGDPRRPRARGRVFEAPSTQNTPRVLASALLGLLVVSAAALVTATVAPLMLYSIPVYLMYAFFVLTLRQQQLRTV